MAWGIFWPFDIAWVYQAIESHVVYMVFHPSIDPGMDNIIIRCFCQWTNILISSHMYTYICTYVFLHVLYRCITQASKILYMSYSYIYMLNKNT